MVRRRRRPQGYRRQEDKLIPVARQGVASAFCIRANVGDVSANDWNTQIIAEFRASSGKVGGQFEGAPLLILHTTGARSGQERLNPLMYKELGPKTLAIFASKGGAPSNPDWYYNLVANPAVTIELKTETHEVTARVAPAQERDPIWEAWKVEKPQFAEYEATANRDIPVVILDLSS